MLPLAWNEAGDPVAPPDGAVGFRVRRATGGKPTLIYAEDGAPLRVPLACTVSELAQLVDEPGRYRLDFVDADGRLLDAGEGGSDKKSRPHHCYAMVSDRQAAVAVGAGESAALERIIASQHRLLQDVIDRSSQVHSQLVSQVSSIMDAAARIVHAADGAGIPQRYVPGSNREELRAALAMAQPADASALPEEVPPWAAAIEALANQALPVVKHVVNTKVLGLDDAQSLQLLGASPAVSLAGAASAAAKAGDSAPQKNGQPANGSAGVERIRSAIAQVLAQLTESERQQAEKMLGALPEAVRRQVVAALSTMPVDEAVTAVRSKLQGGDSS